MAVPNTPGTDDAQEEPKKPKIRRQKKHHGGHHGGAWKVAFADFVTAMMALFLLLWLLASASEGQKAALSQYFKDPGVFKTQQSNQLIDGVGSHSEKETTALAAAEEAQGQKKKKEGSDGKGKKGPDQATVDSLTAKAEAAMKTGDGRLVGYLKITHHKDALRVTMINGPKGMFFYPGTARPTKELQRFLGTLSEGLALVKDTELVITGHTDSKPLPGKKGYGNVDLSTDRASAVKRILSQDGVPEERFREIIGLGSREPTLDDPRDAMNQRVTLDIHWVQPEQEER